MESNGPNPLPWRRTRYQPFHLRANIKIDDLDMAALLLSAFRAAKMGNPSFSSTIAFMTNCPPAELRFRSELRGWERHVLCRSGGWPSVHARCWQHGEYGAEQGG